MLFVIRVLFSLIGLIDWWVVGFRSFVRSCDRAIDVAHFSLVEGLPFLFLFSPFLLLRIRIRIRIPSEWGMYAVLFREIDSFPVVLLLFDTWHLALGPWSVVGRG